MFWIKWLLILSFLGALWLGYESYSKLDEPVQANLKKELGESLDTAKIKAVSDSLGAGIKEEFATKKAGFYQGFKNFVHELCN